MQFPARTPNPPSQGNQSIAAGIPIDLRVGGPPSFRNWMQFPARTPNPPGQGNQAISAGIPTRLTWGGSGMQAVGRRPNPVTLSGWYSSTSTADVARHGEPNVVGPWVEQLEPKLPAMGLLHRKGQPDVRVQIMWNAGCALNPGGSHLCTVFAQELGPADMVRFRLPNGYQGRAQKHRVYRTPVGGQLTANPLAIENVVTVKKAWLPASYNETKPTSIAGTWVQVSPSDARVGLVRVPGGEPQQAYVFEVRKDGQGRLRALVQWTPQPAKNPRADYLVHTGFDRSRLLCRTGMGGADCVRHDIVQSNPGPVEDCAHIKDKDKWLKCMGGGYAPPSTGRRRAGRRPLGTTPASRATSCGTDADCPKGKRCAGGICLNYGVTRSRPTSRVRLNPRRAYAPTAQAGGWWCATFPNSARCLAKEKIKPKPGAGCHWDVTHQKWDCPPEGPAAPRGFRRNPQIVSAAAARAAVNRGGVIGDVASGRKRIVIDSSGVSLKVA
jgi:hypothetical protein